MRLLVILVALLNVAPLSAMIMPIADAVAPSVPDRQVFTVPDRVRLNGWVGGRIAVNEAGRLARIDPARLLEGYRKRPGRQAWDGEHVGKWLHAATLAWVNTGDPVLRERLDYVVSELIKCQLEDGYLGTYVEKDRWTEWDVWAHKYNLIGLLTYIRYTGNMQPLDACRRMGDLLCRTFGDEPGKRDIIKAGHHVGMAPTSVLEPMVLLYRATGEKRYLEFCQYILRAWEQPNGPKIVSTLLKEKRVDKVGNGKAYEMLSCLNGALEYYRTVGGDRAILDACLNAWQDIVRNRLYITGAASYGELFHDDFDLPNVANVGETCVTVTWLQFNAQLLRLTGEARFAEQLEHVVLNQLFGAQRPDGCAWGYYVQMEGKKPYSDSLDGHCCLSSGPRGVALIPSFAVAADNDGVVINLYDAGSANLDLDNRSNVKVTIETDFPRSGDVRISVVPQHPRQFALKLRMPEWASESSIQVNGKKWDDKPGKDGYARIDRSWSGKDKLEVRFTLEPRLVKGDHKNAGKAAVKYGPLVLAADDALLVEQGLSVATVGLPESSEIKVKPEAAPAGLRSWAGAQVYRTTVIARKVGKNFKAGAMLTAPLVPFSDAGAAGSRYKVWLPVGTAATGNLLAGGTESRSRQGNQNGSIVDDDPNSIVVTFDGKKQTEDWFAVELEQRTRISRITFRHGQNFHDGGWFDTSSKKPSVQVKRSSQSDWETIGTLEDYPQTTASDAGQLRNGQVATLRLGAPIDIVAVRVVGIPASGDYPAQAFTSCAELEAFLD